MLAVNGNLHPTVSRIYGDNRNNIFSLPSEGHRNGIKAVAIIQLGIKPPWIAHT